MRKKVKGSRSLIAVGAMGVRVPLYLGHSLMKGRVPSPPFAALSFPYLKKVPLLLG